MTVTTHLATLDIDDSLVTKIRSVGHFACDIETTGLNPRVDRIGTVQIYIPEIGGTVLRVGDAAPERLCRLIEDPAIRKVFHHAMFDLRFMAAHWGISAAGVVCTKIASKLLQPHAEQGEHSLKRLLFQRLGVAISKDQRLSDWLAPHLTSAQIGYATADVEHLLPLLSSLERDLSKAGLLDLFGQCAAFIPTRVRLELGEWPDVFAY